MNDLYGQLVKMEHPSYHEGRVMGMTKHARHIWNKISEELMVLGFISSLAWAVEQFEGFKNVIPD